MAFPISCMINRKSGGQAKTPGEKWTALACRAFLPVMLLFYSSFLATQFYYTNKVSLF